MSIASIVVLALSIPPEEFNQNPPKCENCGKPMRFLFDYCRVDVHASIYKCDSCTSQKTLEAR